MKYGKVFVKPIFQKRPPGYIPGYGRGAYGFITRSDIGPNQLPMH